MSAVQWVCSGLFEQSPDFGHRQPVHVRIFWLAVNFQAPQVFQRCGIVLALDALNFTAIARHKIDLPGVHFQKIEVGPGSVV